MAGQIHQDVIVLLYLVDQQFRLPWTPEIVHIPFAQLRQFHFIFHPVRLDLVERAQQSVADGGDPQMVVGIQEIFFRKIFGVDILENHSGISQQCLKRANLFGMELLEPVVILQCQFRVQLQYLFQFVGRELRHIQGYFIRFLCETGRRSRRSFYFRGAGHCLGRREDD